MIKFLLILFLISYVVYKVGGYLFRIFFINAAQRSYQRSQYQQQEPPRRKAPDSNLNIDYVPQSPKSKKGKGPDRGGEYVDYEDVD